MSANNEMMPDDRLSRVFAAYKEACPDPEPGTDFMPRLWEKIEARRTFAFSLRRLARAIITAAAVASLAMGIYLAQPVHNPSPSYLDLLAAEQTHDVIADAEIVQAAHENGR